MAAALKGTVRFPWSPLGLAVGLALCASWPGTAAEIRFSGVLPGGGVVNKEVLSLRELRYEGMVPQATDFSCGAASVATILKYAYGVNTSELEVLLAMLETSDEETVLSKGFSLLDMKRYVESLGMQAVGFRIAPENLSQVKIPTIVLLDIKGYRHFVVLKRAQGEKVYLADPALGNKVMKLKDFISSWNGVVLAIVADGYLDDTDLAKAQEPVSARRLLATRAPILNAETFEFGVGHSDMSRF